VRKSLLSFPSLFILFSVLVLTGADGGNADNGERASLERERATLQKKTAALKREQDFLVFQKTMLGSDSKYLIVNVSKRTVQLKYKNRLLLDVRFAPSKNFPGRGLKQGMVVLTKKEEGTKGRRALVFGSSFIVQWKRSAVPRAEATVPFIVLPKKEMQSIYYAVEEGALAYVLR
jgi:hypothetical protein